MHTTEQQAVETSVAEERAMFRSEGGRRGAVVWLVDINANARSDLSPEVEQANKSELRAVDSRRR